MCLRCMTLRKKIANKYYKKRAGMYSKQFDTISGPLLGNTRQTITPGYWVTPGNCIKQT